MVCRGVSKDAAQNLDVSSLASVFAAPRGLVGAAALWPMGQYSALLFPAKSTPTIRGKDSPKVIEIGFISTKTHEGPKRWSLDTSDACQSG